MDCHEPVDDFCDAWQADNLKIPKKIPCTDDFDQFYLVFEVETTFPILEDDEHRHEEDKEHPYIDADDDDAEFLTFWAPCPRTKHENLTKERISSMLSRAGVPRHKQEFMIGRISAEADEIANAAWNKDRKVLPMKILISIVACLCFGETVDD